MFFIKYLKSLKQVSTKTLTSSFCNSQILSYVNIQQMNQWTNIDAQTSFTFCSWTVFLSCLSTMWRFTCRRSPALHIQRTERDGLWVIKRGVIVVSDGSLCGLPSEVRPPFTQDLNEAHLPSPVMWRLFSFFHVGYTSSGVNSTRAAVLTSVLPRRFVRKPPSVLCWNTAVNEFMFADLASFLWRSDSGSKWDRTRRKMINPPVSGVANHQTVSLVFFFF